MSICENHVSSPLSQTPVPQAFPAQVAQEPTSRGAEPTETSPGKLALAGHRKRTAPIVLVADDEAIARRMLRQMLESAGYRVLEAEGGRQAVSQMSEKISVAIVNLFLPDMSGLKCLAQIRKHFCDTQVIVVSGNGKTRDAVAAMTQGAFEYLTKPWDPNELVIRVSRAVRAFRLARENRALKQAVSCPLTSRELLGSSARMHTVRAQIEKLAQLDSTVLITGAGGTGKIIAAQSIHRKGPRASEPFVSVNCSALPRELIEADLFGHVQGSFAGAGNDRPGRAEIADGGTLLLDEIGDLPMELQPKLLSFLRERTVRRVGSNDVSAVNVRVIGATKRDLAEMCRQGRFREDLYFRINVLSLHIPALREHFTDIPELANEILHRIARRRGCPKPNLSDAAMRALQQYSWPGNTGEMENVLQQASASYQGTTIERKDLILERIHSAAAPADGSENMGLAGLTLAQIERRAVIETLRACGGNRVRTARQLGVSEKTIYNKIKQYKLAGRI